MESKYITYILSDKEAVECFIALQPTNQDINHRLFIQGKGATKEEAVNKMLASIKGLLENE